MGDVGTCGGSGLEGSGPLGPRLLDELAARAATVRMGASSSLADSDHFLIKYAELESRYLSGRAWVREVLTSAETEAAELASTYNLQVVPIPTNKPLARIDQADLIYKTEEAKFNAVVDDIYERHEKGQPVLIGTTSVERSEYLSRLLTERGVKHNVLNAKFHEQEAQIVAEAGRLGAVTVATNMAGRGTDVVLGGNLTQFMERYLPELRRLVSALNTFENSADYIKLCRYPKRASMLGVALHFIQEFLEKI